MGVLGMMMKSYFHNITQTAKSCHFNGGLNSSLHIFVSFQSINKSLTIDVIKILEHLFNVHDSTISVKVRSFLYELYIQRSRQQEE